MYFTSQKTGYSSEIILLKYLLGLFENYINVTHGLQDKIMMRMQQ